MNITNTQLAPVVMSPVEKTCPRCNHHSVCHVNNNGDIMAVQQKQITLVACFITGCVCCARYHGE